MFSIALRRTGTLQVIAGGDGALVSWPIPSGSFLTNLRGEVHMSQLAPVDETDICVYGMQGWVLKTDTESDFSAMDTLWDSFVPKQTTTVAFDTDSSSDTQAAQELGTVVVPALLNQEWMGPRKVFERLKWISLAQKPIAFMPDGGGAGVDEFMPTDYFKVRMGGKYYAPKNEHAAMLFGVSSPDLASFSGSSSIPGELASGVIMETFEILKHLEEYLAFIRIDVGALHEVGAESPYEDILDWLTSQLDKVNSNASGFTLTTATWKAFMTATAQLVVPGRSRISSIGPDMDA